MDREYEQAAETASTLRGGRWGKARHLWFVGSIIVLTCIVYWQTVTFDFVTYDDYELVYQNETFLSHPSNIVAAFQTHAFTTHRAESAYYRPLLLVSYILDYQIWKLAPRGYHLVNLLIHLIASLCLYVILFLLTGDRIAAWFSGIFFALHPVQTESVAWVAGRNDLLLGLAILLSFLYFIRYRRSSGRMLFLILSLLFFSLALFTKEAAVFYVLIFPLYDFCFSAQPGDKKALSRYYLPYLTLGITVIFYLFIRSAVVGSLIGSEKLYGGTPLMTRLIQMPGIFAEHLSLLLFPGRLSVVHPLDQALWLQPPWIWISLLFPVVILFLLVWSWKKNRLVFFGLGWLVVGLLPALDIFPVAVPILEHRLYLPMAGFALAIVCGSHPVISSSRLRTSAGIAACLLLLICGIRSYVHLPVWQNSEALWNDAIEKAPTYSRSYFNLAGYYYDHRQYERTIGLMKKYLELNPKDQMGYSKLYQTYLAANRIFDAAQTSRSLIPFHPKNQNVYLEPAGLFMETNVPDSTIAVCAEGLTAVPDSYLLHDLMGEAYLLVTKDAQAEVQFHEAIKINPAYAGSHFNLGILYARRGESVNAIAQFEEGMKYGAPDENVVRLLYRLYLDTNQTGKAENLRQRYNL